MRPRIQTEPHGEMNMSYALRIEPESFASDAVVAPPEEISLERLGDWSGAQRKKFARLVVAAMEEVTGRLAGYFSHFEVEVPSIGGGSARCTSAASVRGVLHNRAGDWPGQGAPGVGGSRVRVNLDSAASDEISTVLMQSILDAYAAVCGAMGLGSSRARVREGQFESLCDREDAVGGFLRVRAGEGRPLLIVSNTGVPLSTWSALISTLSFGGRG